VINPDDFPNILDSDIPKLAPPVFTKATVRTMKDIRVEVGDTVTLLCSAMGLPEPRISWYKNSELYRDTGSTLVIEKSNTRDSGTYSCVAQNMVGSASAKYRVTVEEARELEHDTANVSVGVGESAVLDCRVNSEARPSVKWLKKLEHTEHSDSNKVISVGTEHYSIIGDDEDMLHSREREYLSQLAIRSAHPEDSGMYICFVTSGGRGFNFKQSYLTVIQDIGREVEREFPVIVVVLVLAIAITLSIIGLVLCLIQRKPKTSQSQQEENGDIQQKSLTPRHNIIRKNKQNKTENLGVRVTVNKLEDLLCENSPLNVTSNNTSTPLHSTYLLPHQTAPESGEDHLQPVYDLPRAGYGYYSARDNSEKSFKR